MCSSDLLLEELRHPIVDRFVLRMWNLGVFKTADFVDCQSRGVRLTKEGLRRFLIEWERALIQPLREEGSQERVTARALLVRQVDRLAAQLRGGEGYVPYRMPNDHADSVRFEEFSATRDGTEAGR